MWATANIRAHSLAWIPPTKLAGPGTSSSRRISAGCARRSEGSATRAACCTSATRRDADVGHYNFPARPVERYGVHDRAALIPGQLRSYGERWDGDECVLEAVGEVVQAQTYGENLRLTRRYTCRLGESRFIMHDSIENAGYLRTIVTCICITSTPASPSSMRARSWSRRSRRDTPPDVLFGDVADPWTEGRHIYRARPRTGCSRPFSITMLAEPDGSVPVAIVNPLARRRPGSRTVRHLQSEADAQLHRVAA